MAATQETPAATFSFKKRAPVHVELDLDALTWEDSIEFAKVQDKIERGELTQEQGLNAVSDLLSKLVGQDVRKLPAAVVGSILVEFRKLSGVQAEDTKN